MPRSSEAAGLRNSVIRTTSSSLITSIKPAMRPVVRKSSAKRTVISENSTTSTARAVRSLSNARSTAPAPAARVHSLVNVPPEAPMTRPAVSEPSRARLVLTEAP
jgi:hypothetical protein